MDSETEKMVYEIDPAGDFTEMLGAISGWIEAEWESFTKEWSESEGGDRPTAYAFKEFLQNKLINTHGS